MARAHRRRRFGSRSRWCPPTRPALFTVGHARNGAFGDSVARLLELAGHVVEREYYYNDAGGQMERFRASVEAARRGEEPPEDGYRGDYVRDLAALEGDPVPQMLERIEATLERFRIRFDTRALQSELELRLGDESLPRLHTYEKDGAVWARSSAYGDDDDWVLVRSAEQGGLPTYRAADVVYLADKLDRGYDRAIYVLGADHHGTRKWYAAVSARMLGYEPERVEVLLYQLVHLTRGGEATKVSRRRGDVVFVDELIEEIGVDAARWFLVSRGPDQAIEIDVDLAAEKTRRTRSTTSSTRTRASPGSSGQGGAPSGSSPARSPPRSATSSAARRVPGRRRGGGGADARPGDPDLRDPRRRTDFHRSYHHHRVLGSEQESFRLGLCTVTKAVVRRAAPSCIGVEAPDRMLAPRAVLGFRP